MKVDFEREIRTALARGDGLADYLPALRDFRERGLSQADALEVLQALRNDMEETSEDRVLEVMDIVFGYCAPNDRIWK